MPKIRSRHNPLRLPLDSPKMRAAIDALERRNLDLIRPTSHQLKIDDINFYPDKGTIVADNSRALPQRGLKALLKLIDSRNDIPSANELYLELEDSNDGNSKQNLH